MDAMIGMVPQLPKGWQVEGEYRPLTMAYVWHIRAPQGKTWTIQTNAQLVQNDNSDEWGIWELRAVADDHDKLWSELNRLVGEA